MKNKIRIPWGSFAPVVFIFLLISVFTTMTDGRLIQANTLKSLLTQSIGYLIGGLGMIFVMALGEIDMSLGVNVAFSCTTASMLVGDKGWLAVLLVSLLIGTVVGCINAFFVSAFNVQGFMVTIALQIGLRGAIKGIYLLLPSGRITFSPEVLAFNKLSTKLIILLIVTIVVIYLMEFSTFGSWLKAVGENEVCAYMSGIPVKKIKAAAYILCGLFTGVAALFMCSRQGGVTSDTGSGFEMTVMLGMFLGGIPVEGGMETKVYKAIIGIPCLIIIQSGLTIIGVSAGVYQFIEAIILLVVIIMSHYLKEYSKKRDDKIMAQISLEEK